MWSARYWAEPAPRPTTGSSDRTSRSPPEPAPTAENGAEATRLAVGERDVQVPLTGVAVAPYADKP